MVCPGTPADPCPTGLKALVVEDDPASRRLLVRLLGRSCGAILEAGDGAEGLRRFREERPDLVVTDQGLPGLSGLEMVKAIRSEDPEVPVILATGSLDTALLVEALGLGVSSFVHKPFDRGALARALARVTGLVEHRRLQTESLEQELALLNVQGRAQALQQEKALRKEMSLFENELFLRSWEGPADSEWVAQVLYRPRDILCGDSYSLRRLPDGSLLAFLGDAMGKGLDASFSTLLAATLFNVQADASSGGAFAFGPWLMAFTRALRKRLLDDEIFCFTLLRLLPGEEAAEFAAFGMPPLLLKGRPGLPGRLPSNNPPLSPYLEAPAWERHALPGLRQMLLHTDGLGEALQADGQPYRLRVEADFRASPELGALGARFRDAAEVPEDDLSLLLLTRVDGPVLRRARLAVSARMKDLDPACQEAEATLQAWGIGDPERREPFGIALREALLNAYEHGSLGLTGEEKGRLLEVADYPGCLGDLEGRVSRGIQLELRLVECGQDRLLEGRVADEGPGFDPPGALRDLAESTGFRGRGLVLMSRYADALCFNARGNEARIFTFLPKEGPWN